MPVPTEKIHARTHTHTNIRAGLQTFHRCQGVFFLFIRFAAILPIEATISEMKADDLNCPTASMLFARMPILVFLPPSAARPWRTPVAFSDEIKLEESRIPQALIFAIKYHICELSEII